MGWEQERVQGSSCSHFPIQAQPQMQEQCHRQYWHHHHRRHHHLDQCAPLKLGACEDPEEEFSTSRQKKDTSSPHFNQTPKSIRPDRDISSYLLKLRGYTSAREGNASVFTGGEGASISVSSTTTVTTSKLHESPTGLMNPSHARVLTSLSVSLPSCSSTAVKLAAGDLFLFLRFYYRP